tara:strand:- start:1109 stop:1336 length:228 start_codon:yes stop_codon:yes gene_type:complete
MPSDLKLLLIILSGEVTVLTHAEVNTICADEASTYDGSHVTADAFVIIMSRQTVSKKRKFDATELMIFAEYFFIV